MRDHLSKEILREIHDKSRSLIKALRYHRNNWAKSEADIAKAKVGRYTIYTAIARAQEIKNAGERKEAT